MLSHYRQKIHELEPLKGMLITVSEQCDQKIMKIREEVYKVFCGAIAVQF